MATPADAAESIFANSRLISQLVSLVIENLNSTTTTGGGSVVCVDGRMLTILLLATIFNLLMFAYTKKHRLPFLRAFYAVPPVPIDKAALASVLSDLKNSSSGEELRREPPPSPVEDSGTPPAAMFSPRSSRNSSNPLATSTNKNKQ